jgi:hypothetical protein
MPHVMDARGVVGPAVAPAQFPAQLVEHAMHLAATQ